jgi:hypothetical protein
MFNVGDIIQSSIGIRFKVVRVRTNNVCDLEGISDGDIYRNVTTGPGWRLVEAAKAKKSDPWVEFKKTYGGDYAGRVGHLLATAGIQYDVDRERDDICMFSVRQSNLEKARKLFDDYYKSEK